MTDKTSAKGQKPGDPGEASDLARFLRDWTELWREESEARAGDPLAVQPGMPLGMLANMASGGVMGEMTAAMEIWRTAIGGWAGALDGPWSALAAARDSAAAPRAEAVAVAPDARDAAREHLTRDAEFGRLTGRIDELEARLAQLEKPARRRG